MDSIIYVVGNQTVHKSNGCCYLSPLLFDTTPFRFRNLYQTPPYILSTLMTFRLIMRLMCLWFCLKMKGMKLLVRSFLTTFLIRRLNPLKEGRERMSISPPPPTQFHDCCLACATLVFWLVDWSAWVALWLVRVWLLC